MYLCILYLMYLMYPMYLMHIMYLVSHMMDKNHAIVEKSEYLEFKRLLMPALEITYNIVHCTSIYRIIEMYT